MDAKETKNYFPRWNGVPGADRNPATYRRRDDGSHIYQNDQYYEWWYIDCAFDNGYHAVIVYHFRNEYLRPKIPTVQFMIYKPDGTKVTKYAAYPPEKCFAGADYCDVRMGNDWIKDTGDGYELYINIRGTGLRLNLKNVVPPWTPNFIYKNEETGLLHGWTVPIPYGEVSGEIFFGDEVTKVKGAVYHDHNWGTGNQCDLISWWDWGRIHGGRYTLDFSQVTARAKDAPLLTFLLLARDKELVLATDIVKYDFSDYAHDDVTGQDYAKRILVTTDVKDVKMRLDIRTTRLLESMPLQSSTPDWKQLYLRFLADFDLELEIDGEKDKVTGELLHELMVF